MSVTYFLQGSNPPDFSNRVGFTSNPTNSNGWYEDVDSGLIRIEYEFESIGISLIAGTNSFTTNLPYPVASILPFRGSAILSSMTSGVLGGSIGNVNSARDSGTGIVTLTIGFPILSSLSGLSSAKIGVSFSAQVVY